VDYDLACIWNTDEAVSLQQEIGESEHGQGRVRVRRRAARPTRSPGEGPG